MYKYHDILELESKHKKDFEKINYSKNIVVLPPVLRKHGGKTTLAYLVIPEPITIDNRTAVTRPIGILLRHKKSRGLIKVLTADKYEFVPDRNDFEREYYTLEEHPEYWPNRESNENEEAFRLALEELYRTVCTINIFGSFDDQYYAKYKNKIKELFPPQFFYFFDALESNPIEPVGNEILERRAKARSEHAQKTILRQKQTQADNEEARRQFIKETEEDMQMFIRKDIAPSLKNKPAYVKLDFYAHIGKMVKSLELDEQVYFNCYGVTVTDKTKETSRQQLFESLKVNLVKTYSKSCGRELATDETANTVSALLIKMLHTMAIQEHTGKVTSKTKDDVMGFMESFKTETAKFTDDETVQEFQGYYDELYRDYFDTRTKNDMSELYLGYMVSNIM